MKNILINQNPHWQGKRYTSVKRDALDKLISYLPLRQIITITGIRRCGKSTLAKQAIEYLISSGVKAENIFFINLEHPKFIDYQDDPSYLGVIFDEYLKLANPQGKIYCIFDEIQYFKDWQVYIKSMYESSDVKFIVTGSNSSMLSNELNTLLSGRALNIYLKPFSFVEYLRYKEIDISSEMAKISNKIAIARAKEEYLNWGGFYEVFSVEDEMVRKEILINYARNIIYQDIVPRYKIRNAKNIEKLFFYLIGNVTNMINYTSLSKTFEISEKSIKEYLNYFEEVFLFFRVDKYHTKPKERIKSFKKLYCIDNGFLNLSFNKQLNSGIKLENLVFNILSDRCDLTYLRDVYEIDFFCNDTLYQVSYKIDDEKIKKRELRAYEHFNKNGKFKNMLITFDANERLDGVDVVSFDELFDWQNGRKQKE